MWGIMEGWIWLIVIVIIVVGQIIGGLQQLETRLFWIGKQMTIRYWKHNKKWPIEVKNTEESSKVNYRPASGSFEITADVWIRVRKKNAKSKIDNVEIEITSNGHIWKGYEHTLVDLFPSTTKLTDRKLTDLTDGKYTLSFEIYSNDYFREWYEGNITLDIYRVIKIETEGLSCETKPQIIVSGKQQANVMS